MTEPLVRPFKARPPWWGGDLQTLRNRLAGELFGRAPDPGPAARLYLPTEDGPTSPERLAAAHAPGRPGLPLIVLIHGLTGCESSWHMLSAARTLHGAGYPLLRLNLRGAGPGRAFSRDIYHAGRGGDLAAALGGLPAEMLAHGLVAIGFSLGGAMLARFLARDASGLPVLGAVTVSSPLDLAETSRWFRRPRNRLYHRYLLRRMLADARAADLPARARPDWRAVDSVYAFDDRIVAPRFGFAGADAYYEACSPRAFLAEVRVPLRLIHALDDPWVPAGAYRDYDWGANPCLDPVLVAGGGHVGFHEAGERVPLHERLALDFLAGLGGKGDGWAMPA